MIAPTMFSIFLAAFISPCAIAAHTEADLQYSRTPDERPPSPTTIPLIRPHFVDGQWFLFVYESLTSDHPSYTTTPMLFSGWSYKRGSTVQNTLDGFSEAYKLLGLTVNVTKTKVIFQPAQPLTATAPHIDGTTLENVDHLSKSANIDVEIQHRIRCACFSYGRLKDRVFSERGFRTATKILVYKAVILTTLLYGCETDMGRLPSPC